MVTFSFSTIAIHAAMAGAGAAVWALFFSDFSSAISTSRQGMITQ